MTRTQIERTAIRLYAARKRQKAAREAFGQHRTKHGVCDGLSNGHGPCYHKEGFQGEWCDICLEAQPLYIESRDASKEVGIALRSLMQLCSKTSPHQP